MNERSKNPINGVSYVPHLEISSWSGRARIGAGVCSTLALILSQKMKSGAPRSVTRFMAISLGLRALFNEDLTQLMGTLLSPTIRLHREIIVNAPADEVVQFWTRLENYPRFMSFVRSVNTSSHGNLLWEMSGPGGFPVRWESLVESWSPNRTISWVTAPKSPIFNAGTVLVQPLDFERCKVLVDLSYAMRAGALGYAFAHVIGFDPRDRFDHDLSVMKSLVEDEWRTRRSSA